MHAVPGHGRLSSHLAWHKARNTFNNRLPSRAPLSVLRGLRSQRRLLQAHRGASLWGLFENEYYREKGREAGRENGVNSPSEDTVLLALKMLW